MSATTSSSSSMALFAVTGRDRPFVLRLGVMGTVSLLPKALPESSLFPLLDDVVERPLSFGLIFHFLVTLPGLLRNLGGVAVWYFCMASAVGTTLPLNVGAGCLDLKRSSRQNLKGFILRWSGVGGFLL